MKLVQIVRTLKKDSTDGFTTTLAEMSDGTWQGMVSVQGSTKAAKLGPIELFARESTKSNTIKQLRKLVKSSGWDVSVVTPRG